MAELARRVPIMWITFEGKQVSGPAPGAHPYVVAEFAIAESGPWLRTLAMVDTGCSQNLVRPDLAKQLGAPAKATKRMHGNWGAVDVPMHRVMLRLPPARWFLMSCDAGTLDLPADHYAGAAIGMDMLRVGELLLSPREAWFVLPPPTQPSGPA